MDDERFERENGQYSDENGAGGAVTGQPPYENAEAPYEYGEAPLEYGEEPADYSESAEGGEGGGELPEDELRALREAQEFSEQSAETEKQIARQQQNDMKLLEELDAVLERGGAYKSQSESDPRDAVKRRRKRRLARRGVGLFSFGGILIFMGIVMIAALSGDVPNYSLPLKLSPVCAVIMGAEVIIAETVTRGKCRVVVPYLLAAAAFAVGCCVLSDRLGKGFSEQIAVYNNRSVASELYDRSYEALKSLADIEALEVDVDLNPEGQGKFNGADALTSSDIVNISVVFGGVYSEPLAFAEDCGRIISAYRKMNINVTGFRFTNESKLRSYSLEVEGKFAQDFDAQRLAENVNYVYIVDYDYIEDLEDYSEPRSDESDNSDGG